MTAFVLFAVVFAVLTIVLVVAARTLVTALVAGFVVGSVVGVSYYFISVESFCSNQCTSGDTSIYPESLA